MSSPELRHTIERLRSIAALPNETVVAHVVPDIVEPYERRVVRSDDEVEVAVATWAKGGACTTHGHGNSHGYVRIHSGELTEESFVPTGEGLRRVERVLRAGDETFLPAGGLHRFSSVNGGVSVHVYSPPLEANVQLEEHSAATQRHVASARTEASA